MKNLKPKTKSTIKLKKTNKIASKFKNKSDITLNLKKIEKVCVTIYSFFTLFVLVGLSHFLYISLGFSGFELYYLYILLGFLVFEIVGRKAIRFAFNFDCSED